LCIHIYHIHKCDFVFLNIAKTLETTQLSTSITCINPYAIAGDVSGNIYVVCQVSTLLRLYPSSIVHTIMRMLLSLSYTRIVSTLSNTLVTNTNYCTLIVKTDLIKFNITLLLATTLVPTQLTTSIECRLPQSVTCDITGNIYVACTVSS
jgi:hypothetical protein